jgi:hypothetical protein
MWIGAVGDSEVGLRLLSELFAAILMVYLLARFRTRGDAWPFLLICSIGSSWLYSYYAQEVRVYELLLLLSTVCIIEQYEHIAGRPAMSALPYSVLLILLSLSHYFGLILAGALLVENFLFHRQLRVLVRNATVGTVALIWPIYHAIQGHLLGKTNGHFWIKATGHFSTARTAIKESILKAAFGFSNLHDLLGFARWHHIGTLFGATVVVGISAGAIIQLKRQESNERRALGAIILILVMIVAGVTIIDQRTPLSTPRNFIILLPAFAIVLANVCKGWTGSTLAVTRIGGMTLFFLLMSLAVLDSVGELQAKQRPLENWRDGVAFAASSGICQHGCLLWQGHSQDPDELATSVHVDEFAYYIGRAGLSAVASAPAAAPQIFSTADCPKRPVLAGHVGTRTLLAMQTYCSALHYYFPTEIEHGSFFIAYGDVEARPVVSVLR